MAKECNHEWEAITQINMMAKLYQCKKCKLIKAESSNNMMVGF